MVSFLSKRFILRGFIVLYLALIFGGTFFLVLEDKRPKIQPQVKAAVAPPNTDTLYTMPVLVLSYFPTKDGVNVDPDEVGFSATIDFLRKRIANNINKSIYVLEEGSKYHGYKNSSALSSLDYSIFEEKEFFEYLPRGLEVPWKSGQGIYRPDYMKMLNAVNVCDYIDNKGVKDVWIMGYHYNDIEPTETNMSGPWGDYSNSERSDDLPHCAKTYVVYNFNYNGDGDISHIYGHHMEAVHGAIDPDIYWGKFVGPWTNYNTTGNTITDFNRCGWTHNPPNVGIGKEYITWDTRYVWTDCEDWLPDGSGEKVYTNCERWGCSESSWQVYRFQNMPGRNNGNPIFSNWWDFIGDFDKAMETGEKLYYPTPIPTPIPTPTPLPTTDTDGDNFGDYIESYIGTDLNKACGAGAWPPDVNDDAVVNTADIDLVSSAFGTESVDAGYVKRYDLDADLKIDLSDISLVGSYSGKTCAAPTPTPLPVSGDPSLLTATASCNGSSPVITFNWQDNSNYESGFWLDVSRDPFNGPSNTNKSPSVWGVKGMYRINNESSDIGIPVQFAWDNEPLSLTAGSMDSGDSDSAIGGNQTTPQSGVTYFWRVKAFNFGQGTNHIYPGSAASPPGQSVTAISCP